MANVPRKLAFLSGAPRVSTKSIAGATGARQHVLGTIGGFRANGWDVAAYVVGDKVPERWLPAGQESTIAGSFFKRLAADGVRILLSATHTLLALRTIRNPDWVYERAAPFAFFGYFFRLRGIPWILETNLLMYEELVSDRKSVALPWLVRWAEDFAYRKCDVLVVISDDLKNAIVRKLGIAERKIVVVPNAADTETFDPKIPARRLFDAETFVIGFQGSMYKWAGLEYLLRGVAELRKNGSNVAAVLLGGGHEREHLEALAAELGIGAFVAFPGLVARERVPEYIAGYDLCFSGQINLTNNSMYLSPLKLYDYMAMGKPVIASRFIDAVNLTKNGEIGYLFTPEDQADFVATATRAYGERAGFAALGVAAREEIVANHSWSSRMRDFIAVAQTMVRGA